MTIDTREITVWNLLIDGAYTDVEDNYILARVSRTLRQLVEAKSKKLFHAIQIESIQGNEIVNTSTSGSLNPNKNLTCRLNKLVLSERQRAKMDIPCYVSLTRREVLRQRVYTAGIEASFPLPFLRRWGVFEQWRGIMDFTPLLQYDYLFVEGDRIDQFSVIRIHALDFQPRFILPLGWAIDIKEKYLLGNIMMATFLRFYSRKRHWGEARRLPHTNTYFLDSRDLLILDLERWAYRVVDLYKHFENVILPTAIEKMKSQYNILPTDFAETHNRAFSQILALPKAISFRSNSIYQKEKNGPSFPYIIEGTNDHVTMKINGQLQFKVTDTNLIPSINFLETTIDTLIITSPSGTPLYIYNF